MTMAGGSTPEADLGVEPEPADWSAVTENERMMTGLAPVGLFMAGLPALLTMVDSFAAAPCTVAKQSQAVAVPVSLSARQHPLEGGWWIEWFLTQAGEWGRT